MENIPFDTIKYCVFCSKVLIPFNFVMMCNSKECSNNGWHKYIVYFHENTVNQIDITFDYPNYISLYEDKIYLENAKNGYMLSLYYTLSSFNIDFSSHKNFAISSKIAFDRIMLINTVL